MQLLTKTALAERLSVAPKTIDRWISLREIPFIRVGRLVRFDWDEIRVWLDDRRVEAA